MRSSIASVFKVIHKDKQPLANQQIIQNFFTAKKISEVKLPSKQEASTWDLGILLQYLVRHFQDNNTLSLTQLQDKVILLLCIATMFPPRSDIGTLQHRDIEFTFENNSSPRNQIVLDMTLYIRQPKEAQTKTARLGRLDLEFM